jgi:transcriptional regulator with XRE-family HTH domain
VSKVLRNRREVMEISQSDLARRSGLHRSYIGDLERGARNLSVRNLSRLATAVGLMPSKLLALAEKQTGGASSSKKPRQPTKESASPRSRVKKGNGRSRAVR